MNVEAKLKKLRSMSSSQALTIGLDSEQIRSFENDPNLLEAVDNALTAAQELQKSNPEVFAMDEEALCKFLQQDFVNFYSADTINPYVPLASSGPWIVTTRGALIHDSGGYGMLGFGQNPKSVDETMSRSYTMANIMTPSVSHKRFTDAMKREVGQTRKSGCPYFKFVALNSGSESMTLACRIADIHAFQYKSKKIRFLSIEGSFHGRTEKPAEVSGSTLAKYQKHLASFYNRDNLDLLPAGDVKALKDRFEYARKNDTYYSALFFEPVMGEGNPGVAVTPEYYKVMRDLTTANDTLLIADSIQAGFRGFGVLSVMDYPGFQELPPPDMETYSKALNGGQYPLSVVALSKKAAETYVTGMYGNTMTTNPRALEVAVTVLQLMTPALRKNIVEAGKIFVEKLKKLAQSIPDVITGVQGTGLLIAADINPKKFDVIGFQGLETLMRKAGIGVIHGGKNALRFTPHFAIQEKEIDLIVNTLKEVIIRAASK